MLSVPEENVWAGIKLIYLMWKDMSYTESQRLQSFHAISTNFSCVHDFWPLRVKCFMRILSVILSSLLKIMWFGIYTTTDLRECFNLTKSFMVARSVYQHIYFHRQYLCTNTVWNKAITNHQQCISWNYFWNNVHLVLRWARTQLKQGIISEILRCFTYFYLGKQFRKNRHKNTITVT